MKLCWVAQKYKQRDQRLLKLARNKKNVSKDEKTNRVVQQYKSSDIIRIKKITQVK